LTESLKEGGRGSGEGARRNYVRGALVVSELAIAVVLLVGAGLLLKSLWRLQTVESGLKTENIFTYNLALPEIRYSSEKQSRFYYELNSRIKNLPGVQSVSSIIPLPLSGDRFGISFKIEGRPVAPKDEPSADFFSAETGYFKTMGIPIIKGRDFDEHDLHSSRPVTIISQEFARQYFPNEEPVGKRIQPGISTYEDDDSTMREIIGVVGDIRNRTLNTAPKPAYYMPQSQIPFTQMTVVVKTGTDPHSLVSAVTKEVAAMDKDLPLFIVKTMDEYLSSSVATPRFNTTLLSIFALVALILTIVGLYGVMSYSVAQRTNEIGIRLALGAQTRDVIVLIVTQGLRLILLGLAVGLIGAFALTRVISSLLFGVTAKDPLTYDLVALALALV
jgi:predicted permease